MMQNLITHFNALPKEQILNQVPGAWGDFELLDVAQHFLEAEDKDREMAVYDLILRSPEVSEMVDYWVVYDELVNYFRKKKEYQTALCWAYARIAFDEQHEEGFNRLINRLDLADIYIQMGHFNPGILMYTERLQLDPDNLLYHDYLGRSFLGVGLSGLAVTILDEGLSRIEKDTAEIWRDQLTELREQAISQTPESRNPLTIIDPYVLADFQVALTTSSIPEPDVDEPEPYPQSILRLMEDGKENIEAVYAEIKSLGPPAIPDLIRLAFDRNPERTSGSKHAIQLLRAMQQVYPAELEKLRDWLDQAEGDWQQTLLSSTTGKIGGYQTLDLYDTAANIGLDTGVRVSALLALAERAQTIPEEREDIIHQFQLLLTRPEAFDAPEETFIGALIDIACDLDARELYPEIRQAYDEDRVDTFYISLSDVHEVWELDPIPTVNQRTDGMYLPLKCKTCGRTREHFTQYVMVEVDTLNRQSENESTPYDPYILDHAIKCPKCQSVDRYEFTTIAFARITGPEIFQAIAATETKKAPKIKPNPRVFFFRAAVFGEPMHPLAGLEEYQRRLTIHPEDTDLLLGVGTLLRTILRYPEALQAHRKAYPLAPDDTEVLITCAFTEHDLGDSENARKLYQQVIDHGRSAANRKDRVPTEITIAAVNGLRLLDQGKPSPWEGHFQNEAGRIVPHPSTLLKEHPARKKKTKRGRRRKR